MIKNWIKKISEKLHIHNFSKPIVSRYVSFNTRDIVYECGCGKREIVRTHQPFGTPFPIATTMNITQKEIEKIANNRKRT